MVSFGEELKRIRESRGMTVNQLGMYSHVSPAAISRYETGDRNPPKPPTIKKLAEALKYPYNELLVLAGHLEDTEDYKEDDTRDKEKQITEYIRNLPDDKLDFLIEVIKQIDGKTK